MDQPIPTTDFDTEQSPLATQARQEIEYLRRWYARATDLLGRHTEAPALAEGQRIYDRIFTTDARIRVTESGRVSLSATGPDGWVAVVREALQAYAVTQHLIGTQLVDIRHLSPYQDDQGTWSLSAGEAEMSSYLQAWHAWPDGRLRLVIGNYVDQVRYVPGVGWQIHDMNLVHLSSEHRQLGRS